MDSIAAEAAQADSLTITVTKLFLMGLLFLAAYYGGRWLAKHRANVIERLSSIRPHPLSVPLPPPPPPDRTTPTPLVAAVASFNRIRNNSYTHFSTASFSQLHNPNTRQVSREMFHALLDGTDMFRSTVDLLVQLLNNPNKPNWLTDLEVEVTYRRLAHRVFAERGIKQPMLAYVESPLDRLPLECWALLTDEQHATVLRTRANAKLAIALRTVPASRRIQLINPATNSTK